MDSLRGAVGIVTGASRGVGRDVASRLAAEDVTVVCAARSASELSTLVDEIRDHGGAAVSRVVDLRNAAECTALVEWTANEIGVPQIIINNAGLGYWAPVADATDSEWRETIAVNLDATFYLSRAALEPMLKAGQGHIVNIASVSALSGRVLANMAPYCAVKAAVIAFSEALSKEVRQHGIKVSVILPGAVNTNFRDRHVGRPLEQHHRDPARQLRVDDVASAVIWALKTSAHVGHLELVLEPKG